MKQWYALYVYLYSNGYDWMYEEVDRPVEPMAGDVLYAAISDRVKTGGRRTNTASFTGASDCRK